jgi:hypothetical protein
MAVGFPAKTNFATGDVLTATNMNDVTGTLNLLQSAQYAAGKNEIINGAMQISQRGTVTIGASGYCLDRYKYAVASAIPTGTISQQTFTPGTAPVAGYEGSNFARINVTANAGCTALSFENQIEDVRTLAGQTATFSFYAKADAAATLGSVSFVQNFGSGGSGEVYTDFTMNSTSLTSNWVRYTGTITVPSISGKTIGTGSYVRILVQTPLSGGVVRNGTYDYWGWQLEAASTASPFQTASGTLQGELALCQRYYYRSTAGSAYANFGVGSASTTTNAIITVPLIVSMRTSPASVEYSTLTLGDGAGINAISALTMTQTTPQMVQVEATSSSLTQFRLYRLLANNSTSGYLGFSAEL